ncbi:hypothetical protein BDW74DRAFT_166227 [Aspergillus multicolor]|uniref:alpha/beta fold hydrolase n=1 Tax=Aspergillus multicolor TaxID=41759 RepID=UPI003CCCE51D
MSRTQLRYRALPTSQANVFYHEAGASSAPVILLLHGFPSLSHQFQNPIPILATKYRVLAPDLPGFAFTTVPDDFQYTFDNLATVISEYLDDLQITKLSNGNAYDEGLGAFWDQVRELWDSGNNSHVHAKLASGLLSFEVTKWQYEEGTPAGQVIAPESYHLDYALLQRPGNAEIQLDLFWDYGKNLPLYHKFQECFRHSRVPLLAVWGKNDQIFVPPGAEAFRRDLPDAEVHLLDAGHFAVETETERIGELILNFLGKNNI